MPRGRLKILVLSEFDPLNANVIRDYLFAFNAHSVHGYHYVFDCRVLERDVDFGAYDVIVIFWSLYLFDGRLSDAVRDRIRASRALKVLFKQDEHYAVRSLNRIMSQLGVQVMCTCVDEADHETFYPSALIPSLQGTYTVLTGYVATYLERARVDFGAERPLDIAYRSRMVPPYLGDLGREKGLIADRFERIAWENGWRADISVREEDRIYGRRWLEFLRSACVTLGSASGASVVDFTGEIQRRCVAYLTDHPETTYDELKARFFADVDWKVVIETISPRIFEAAALGCALVLHEGRYAGILEPDRHYIEVRRDYGNLNDVLDRMHDPGLLRRLAEQARHDLIASGVYSYRAFCRRFDAILEAHAGGRVRVGTPSKAAFYVRQYLRHDSGIVPAGAGFVTVPTVSEARTSLDRLRQRVARMLPRPPQAAVALALILANRPLRRLFVRRLRTPVAWRPMGGNGLLADCLRLAVVRQAQAGTLTAWIQPFGVSARLEAKGAQLTLTSWPMPTEGPSPPADRGRRGEVERLCASLGEGRLSTIAWDHRAIGVHVPYGLSPAWWLSVDLGRDGIYRFRTLESLARRFPDEVTAVLEPVLREDPTGAPSFSFGRARVAFRLALREEPTLRRLFVRYLLRRKARQAVSPGLVLGELVRLVIIEQARRGALTAYIRAPFTVTACVEPETGSLLFTSRPRDNAATGASDGDAAPKLIEGVATLIRGGRLARIVWEHWGFGSYVPYGWSVSYWPRFGMGQGECYAFAALPLLARLFPDATLAVLRRVLLPPRKEPLSPRRTWNPVNAVLQGIRRLLGAAAARVRVAVRSIERATRSH